MAVKSKVGDWLEMQYLQWQVKSKGKKTWGDFAEYLGFARQTVDNWSRGDRKPDEVSIALLAKRTGDYEIYTLMGRTAQDALKQKILAEVEALDEEGQLQVKKLVDHINAEREKREAAKTKATKELSMI